MCVRARGHMQKCKCSRVHMRPCLHVLAMLAGLHDLGRTGKATRGKRQRKERDLTVAARRFGEGIDRGSLTHSGAVAQKGYHWSNAKADLGHALVTVDLMASQLAYYKTDYVLFWNTRWRTSYNDESAAPGSVVDAMWVSPRLSQANAQHMRATQCKTVVD